MKKVKKFFISINVVILALVMFTSNVSAITVTKYSTYVGTIWGITFSTVTLSAQGDNKTGKVYDVWFSRLDAIYPMYFGNISTRSYTIGNTGYAKGTFTWKGGLTMSWIDLPLRTGTETITIIF